MVENEKIMVTVHIPCKTYIKKYLMVRYGDKHTMTKTSLLGTFLFHVLDKKTPRPKIKLSDFDAKYDILVSEDFMNKRGFDIGYKKKHYLAKCFEKIFMEDMVLTMLLAHAQFRIKPLDAMRCFLKHYNISEVDVNFDSLYRQYQREKNAIIDNSKNIKVKKNVC